MLAHRLITVLFALAIAAPALARLAPALADPAPDQGHRHESTIALFASAKEARDRCPSDTVIHVELPKGFYLHGDEGYPSSGETLADVYVCRADAMRGFQRPDGSESSRR